MLLRSRRCLPFASPRLIIHPATCKRDTTSHTEKWRDCHFEFRAYHDSFELYEWQGDEIGGKRPLCQHSVLHTFTSRSNNIFVKLVAILDFQCLLYTIFSDVPTTGFESVAQSCHSFMQNFYWHLQNFQCLLYKLCTKFSVLYNSFRVSCASCQSFMQIFYWHLQNFQCLIYKVCTLFPVSVVHDFQCPLYKVDTFSVYCTKFALSLSLQVLVKSFQSLLYVFINIQRF